ncbi:hypothetical protein [Jannaschia sp. CCS1]|uniref:hypothetical protein n=1 Tax=Jannaschia sp. (strain CCS1) TaxID=290400 RepID=UPI000053CFC7|nr:hypothetical protein [Jannaschia sp. CCS1]ABD53737.1 hypothetical protein Jann_0820 [Jannaschia sp. CCS1]
MVSEQVRERAKAGPIPKADYQALFDALEAERSPRDPEWVQAWIILHCATRQRAFACQRLLSRYNRQCVKRGTMGEYSEFLRHVQDDLGFYLPNGNAYTENFRGVDVGEIMAQCGELAARFAELELEVFANSGTLLGIVREGTLLEHDNDIDLGVLLTARTFEGAAQEWIALTDKLIADGVGVSRSTWSKVTLKLQKIGAFGVDLFPAWIDADDKVYVYPHTFGALRRDQLLPYDLHGPTGLHLPADAEAMLECNYGEGWRVPNVGWGFDWKTANAQFEAFLTAVEAAAAPD